MTIGIADGIRASRANVIKTARDAGAAGGFIRIYSGARPSKGGAATTLLAQLQFSTTSSPDSSDGILTASAITGDTGADNSGEATWFREVDSDGTFILDGDVSLAGGGGDLILNDVNVISDLPVNISSYVITEGNN